MITLAVVNFKGGTGKTTTAAFIAHALYEQGKRVIVIDADPQGSAERWSNYAGGWPMKVASLPSTTFHREVRGVVSAGFEVAVVDTGRGENRTGNRR